MAPKLSFNLDALFRQQWPATPISEAEDHAHSLLQQWSDNSQQGREHPWYGVYQGTAIPHLCRVWSQGPSNLRLESAPVSELYYDTTLNTDQQAKIRDPDYIELSDNKVDEARSDQSEDELPVATSREVANLMKLSGNWIPSGTKEDRRAKASRAKGSPAPTPPASQGAAAPDSQSSTASVSLPKRVRIVRVNDGMVFARAKLSYLQEMMPGSDLTSAPALPALSLELKVPNWPRDERVFDIDEVVTRKTIENALPQIVQHTQFIFHAWKKLTVVWALGACGNIAMFFQFVRKNNPDIDPVLISSGEYYSGALPANQIPFDESDTVKLMDSDGHYTQDFQKWWRKVIMDVEQQYAYVDVVDLTALKSL